MKVSALMRSGGALTAVLALFIACGQKAEDKSDTEPAAVAAAPSLNEQLEEVSKASAANVPPEVLKIGADFTESLAQSGIVESSLQVGDKAPSFELQNAVGETVSSETLLAQGPLVIQFYRGGW